MTRAPGPRARRRRRAPTARARWWRVVGVRRRTALVFAVGAVVVCSVLASATFVIARGYLLAQRERGAVRQATTEARMVRDGLAASDGSVSDVLGRTSALPAAQVLLQQRGRWFSTSLQVGPDDLPAQLRALTPAGPTSVMWVRVQGEPALVVTVPLPQVDAVFHEVVGLTDLQSTLDTLRLVLVAVAAATAVAAAALGRQAAARAVSPLDDVAAAATRIGGGDLSARLDATSDPDLAAIVASFNTMADALEARIAREARFTADVSHELRSPLTTLVAGVDLLGGADLPERSRGTVELVSAELTRFRRVLDDLLELARLDAGVDAGAREDTDLAELVRHALLGSGRPADVVTEDGGPLPVRVAKRQVERALVNLFDNADLHGDGLVAVGLGSDRGSALVTVDDRGPGVPPQDRERIFDRFARGGASRGSRPGTGLGLALAAETLRAHDGSVWCADRPGPGGRFVVRIPLAGTGPR